LPNEKCLKVLSFYELWNYHYLVRGLKLKYLILHSYFVCGVSDFQRNTPLEQLTFISCKIKLKSVKYLI
jgi:hypothetical protein